ncbi:MAG: hypothetical protein KDM63_16345, partial [Verrucomicrobiae bacterium]|nr:hypothetical protein [Verrucomicrobiae bacterium]
MDIAVEFEARAVAAEDLEGVAAIGQGQVSDSTGLNQEASVSLIGLDSASGDLNAETLKAIADVAAQRWGASGLNADQLEALSAVEYEVRDLGGLTAAFSEGNKIVVDNNAGGMGWFVDSTPEDDSEFAADADGGQLVADSGEAAEGVDLLTILMHEQGHILGLGDDYDADSDGDLMHGGIVEGVRRLPEVG